MKKYEQFNIEQLQDFCNQSESYRDLAKFIGYSVDGGSSIKYVKEAIVKYNLDISHFKGQGHSKNIGKKRIPTEDYLTNKVSTTSYRLRNRLLEEQILEYRCCCCKLDTWLNQPIPLELHHKDGNKNNNALENLELRCPNCHYFTDTYKSKNRSSCKSESDN